MILKNITNFFIYCLGAMAVVLVLAAFCKIVIKIIEQAFIGL